jgi:hypothetical protein
MRALAACVGPPKKRRIMRCVAGSEAGEASGVMRRAQGKRQVQQAKAARSTGNVLSTAKERLTYLRSMASHAAGNGTLAVSTRGGGWRASSENHQARSAPQPSPAGSGS